MKKIILFCLLLPVLALGSSFRGDANGDGVISVGDIAFQVDYLYNGGLIPDPPGAGDVNGDSSIDISDAILLAELVFGPVWPPAEPDTPASDSTTYHVLFIGSSYFSYNDLPGLFRQMAVSRSKTVDIHTAITNGLYLADHAILSTTEAKINEKDWDYVILQGGGLVMAYPDSLPDYHPVYPALVTLRDKIRANCRSTKMVFTLPWAFEDGMIWVSGWVDQYKEMQEKIYYNTLEYSDSIGFVIAPAGWAWNTVLAEQGYPLHYLHLSDWNHPSLRGSYLMACAIYATVFRQPASGIEYTSSIPEEEASYFQDVASEIVMDSLSLWKIAPFPEIIHSHSGESGPD